MTPDELKAAEREALGSVGPGDLKVGDSVRWWHVSPGGYGFGEWVAGKVLNVTAKRVTIELERIVPLGEPREFVKRVVRFESLRRPDK